MVSESVEVVVSKAVKETEVVEVKVDAVVEKESGEETKADGEVAPEKKEDEGKKELYGTRAKLLRWRILSVAILKSTVASLAGWS